MRNASEGVGDGEVRSVDTADGEVRSVDTADGEVRSVDTADGDIARAFGYVDSPIGLVEIAASCDAVTSLCFVDGRRSRVRGNAVTAPAVEQVTAYLGGTLREFDVPLELHGTDFQRLVWQRLASIPFGETVSYGELARAIGRPAAVRAVGAANAANPISIILPCHRVVGSDGSLTGYGGGLWRKEWLLAHEGSRLL